MKANTILSQFIAKEYTNKKFIIISLVFIVIITIDLLISNIAAASSIASTQATVGFIAITVVYVITQFFILEFVRKKSESLKVRSSLVKYLDKIVAVIQYSVMLLPISIVLSMLLNGIYYTAILTWGISIIYLLSITIISILSLRFFLWYKSKKDFVILLYGLSSLIIAVRIAVTLAFYVMLLLGVTPERSILSDVFIQDFDTDSILGILNNAYTTTSSIAFMLMWVATAILLHNYYYRSKNVKTLSQIKYWLIVAIIPAYSMSDYFISDVVIPVTIGFDNVNYEIFITFQGLGAGILLSIPFWVMARSIRSRSIPVRDYLTMSAIGIILFFTASSAMVDHAPYPPYGFLTILSMALSSYMILIGLYSSAISVSFDRNLRSFIQKSVINQSKLLDSIGSADLYQQIEKQVEKKLDEISTETGFESHIDESDIKEYLQQVIDEIQNQKKGS